MPESMKTVDVDWSVLDRSKPVTLIVHDERSATLKYKRTSLGVTGDDARDRTNRARAQIAQWAKDASVQCLPVVLYDVSKVDPTMLLLVCTNEADFVHDEQASYEDRANAEANFARWRKENAVAQPKPEPRRARRAAAPEALAEPPAPEPEVEDITVTRETVYGLEPEEDLDDPTDHVAPEEVLPPEEQAGPDSPFRMPSLMDEGKDDDSATRGWRGSVNQLLGLHLAPDAAELQVRADVADIVKGWTGSKVVSVVNDKGGAGKTPTAINLSAAMARHIAFLVALFDNNESAGLAHERVKLVGDHTRTAKHLAQFAREHDRMWDSDMEAFSRRHAEDRYHLLAAHHPSTDNPPLTRAEVKEVYRTLAKFYRLTITDSGNTWTAENWLTMIQHTDQLVVPIVTSADRDKRAQDLLNILYGMPERYANLATNSIVVISQWRKEDRKAADAAVERWQGRVRDVVYIPFDEHIGSHNMHFDALRDDTQAAYIHLAASVARGLRGEPVR